MCCRRNESRQAPAANGYVSVGYPGKGIMSWRDDGRLVVCFFRMDYILSCIPLKNSTKVMLKYSQMACKVLMVMFVLPDSTLAICISVSI